MFLVYPFMALASWSFAVLTWVCAPLIALTINPSTHNLPTWLYWFQTFDNDFVTGPQSVGWKPSYWSSVRWLWRNPSYGFDMFLLGCPWTQASDWTVVSDTPTCFLAYSKWGAFSYRGVWFKWGWKAWARLSGTPGWTQFDKVPIVVMR